MHHVVINRKSKWQHYYNIKGVVLDRRCKYLSRSVILENNENNHREIQVFSWLKITEKVAMFA